MCGRCDWPEYRPGQKLNVPLLRKTREHIEAHPKQHDQEVWLRETSCGTTGCVAGWACHFAGVEPSWSLDSEGRILIAVVYDGQIVHPAGVAAELLGLTPDQEDWLFDSDRARAEIFAYVDYLIREHDGHLADTA